MQSQQYTSLSDPQNRADITVSVLDSRGVQVTRQEAFFLNKTE
jgi:hypothetical protein